MRRRSLLLAPVLVAGALLSTGSTDPVPEAPPVPPSVPSNLEEGSRLLDALARRLDVLVALAGRDPGYDTVAAYAAYRAGDFASRKRITAGEIVALWADPSKPMDLREKAWAATLENTPKSDDPDLLAKKGSLKPRNRFAMSEVVPLLDVERDPQTRRFAAEWLAKMFLVPPNEPAIQEFDPRKSDAKETRAAQAAWNKFLRR